MRRSPLRSRLIEWFEMVPAIEPVRVGSMADAVRNPSGPPAGMRLAISVVEKASANPAMQNRIVIVGFDGLGRLIDRTMPRLLHPRYRRRLMR